MIKDKVIVIAGPTASGKTLLSIELTKNFVEPSERYSAARYKKEAIEAIKTVIAKGKTPIVVRRNTGFILIRL